MNIDNITSDSMSLTYNGKEMLIKVYEQEIKRLKEQLNDEIDDELKQSEIMVKKQEENERLNNIINTILDFDFFKEECPLNFGYQEKCDEEKAQEVFYEDDYCEETCNDDYKKCWLKYFKRLQELKGSDKE